MTIRTRQPHNKRAAEVRSSQRRPFGTAQEADIEAYRQVIQSAQADLDKGLAEEAIEKLETTEEALRSLSFPT
jgi:hypothetical protein